MNSFVCTCMFILYSNHLLIFTDFQNNVIQKENISCIPRCVLYCPQALNNTANAAINLLTAHEKNSPLCDKILK